MDKKLRTDYRPYFLLLILVLVILLGLLLKCNLELIKKECVWVLPTSTTTTTTLPPEHVPKIVRSCDTDSDCEWLSTNCCPETAGANWGCINRQSDVSCHGIHVICPQVISPRPTSPCVCIGGVCGG